MRTVGMAMGVSGVQLRVYDGYGSKRCSVVAINAFGVEFCTKARASECRFPCQFFSSTVVCHRCGFPCQFFQSVYTRRMNTRLASQEQSSRFTVDEVFMHGCTLLTIDFNLPQWITYSCTGQKTA